MMERMKKSIIVGIILGIFCVIGAYARSGSTASMVFIFSLWYNRVLLGVVIGAPWSRKTLKKRILRGALLGTLVSFAFYSSTGFADHISFLAGIVYGVILEVVLEKLEK